LVGAQGVAGQREEISHILPKELPLREPGVHPHVCARLVLPCVELEPAHVVVVGVRGIAPSGSKKLEHHLALALAAVVELEVGGVVFAAAVAVVVPLAVVAVVVVVVGTSVGSEGTEDAESSIMQIANAGSTSE